MRSIIVKTTLRDGSPMAKEEIEKNLLHEITHAILNEGGYTNSSADEPMVEWIAKCLQSILKQNIL